MRLAPKLRIPRAAKRLRGEAFMCPRYHVRLDRAVCAGMFAALRTSPRAGHDAVQSAAMQRCGRCPVGQQHAHGEPASGCPTLPPIIAAVDMTQKLVRPLCLTCGMRVRRGRSWFCSGACGSDHNRLRVTQVHDGLLDREAG